MKLPPAPAVYALSCACHPEDGVRYIGQTIRPLPRRLAEHRRDALRQVSGAVVYKWMRGHGVANIQIALLEALPDADTAALNAAEAFWMREFSEKTPYVLNMWTPRTVFLAN